MQANSHWVPKAPSDQQMATRASVCSALLKCFRSKDDFLLHLVTVDETLLHYYEPENKAQSSVGRVWVPESKVFQDTTKVGKVMAEVFWDAKGVMWTFYPREVQ